MAVKRCWWWLLLLLQYTVILCQNIYSVDENEYSIDCTCVVEKSRDNTYAEQPGCDATGIVILWVDANFRDDCTVAGTNLFAVVEMIVDNNCLLVLFFQTMEMARNPAMLQEMMRQQDRAMSNLEVNCIMNVLSALLCFLLAIHIRNLCVFSYCLCCELFF